MSKDNWRWILIAKGIGIALVVIGHFRPAGAPQWWHELVQLIYTFHMPLFFLLSGYLFVYGKQRWGALVRGKVKRLVYPFISIALIFLVIKLAAGYVTPLQHPISAQSFVDLLLNPAVSFMPLLWFMHALFLMFVLYTPLRIVLRHNAIIMLVIIAINTLWISDYPGLNRVLAHFPFFVAGIWLRESGQLQTVQDAGWMRISTLFILLFAWSYALSYGQDITQSLLYPARLSQGLLGALAIVTISNRIDLTNSALVPAIAGIGFYSMTIYLIHTLFESGVRVAAFRLAGLSEAFFLPVAITAVLTGLLLPMLLEKYLLRKVNTTRVYVLGLDRSEKSTPH